MRDAPSELVGSLFVCLDIVALGEDVRVWTGTLLAADVVLAAGHGLEADPIEVVVGSVDLARPATVGTR